MPANSGRRGYRLQEAGREGHFAVTAPGSEFLDERLSDAPSRDVLASRRWSAVVFQAQKYGSSGQFSCSTAEAAQAVIDLSPRLYCPADTFPG
jgi:hypothetical protein